MRVGPRRLPLIALGALGASIALILAGTYVYRAGASIFGFGQSPAERVSLKPSDLPSGMTQCTSSAGPAGKGGTADAYGAADEWTTVYAETPQACNLPPSGRHVFTWVLGYQSERAAVAGFNSLVGSSDCSHGCVEWGLGPNFTLACGDPQGTNQSGTVSCLGTWQRNAFVLTFAGAMGFDAVKHAVLNMDARAQQNSSTKS